MLRELAPFLKTIKVNWMDSEQPDLAVDATVDFKGVEKMPFNGPFQLKQPYDSVITWKTVIVS